LKATLRRYEESDGTLAFWKSIGLDMLAHIPIKDREMSSWKRAVSRAQIVMCSSGFHLSLLYRVGHSIRPRFGPLGRLGAAISFWLSRRVYGCAISPKARLGGGLIFPHPQNIVIGPEVVIGARAWIFQSVTLGGGGRRPGMPRIGSDARILTGAVVAGGIEIGNSVTIGANTVVSKDVPSGSVVRPAEVEVLLNRRDPQAVAE
jgi:serine O-acetyltransferase